MNKGSSFGLLEGLHRGGGGGLIRGMNKGSPRVLEAKHCTAGNGIPFFRQGVRGLIKLIHKRQPNAHNQPTSLPYSFCAQRKEAHATKHHFS